MYKVWKNVPIKERRRIVDLPIQKSNKPPCVALLFDGKSGCPLGALNGTWFWPSESSAFMQLRLRGWGEGINYRNISSFMHAFDLGKIDTPEKLRKALGVPKPK